MCALVPIDPVTYALSVRYAFDTARGSHVHLDPEGASRLLSVIQSDIKLQTLLIQVFLLCIFRQILLVSFASSFML